MSPPPITQLAILHAKQGRRQALQQALRALVPLTRQETGCLDYTLFERADRPGCFYMRESFQDQAALQAHFDSPYFQAFASRMGELLEQPLELVRLQPVP